ncbi:AMP phosphorylase [Candidatus Woesearchaeota archaeon]|nr:AMP phosphorylase [Candidatus Woesearchaeota archaeon]
MKLKPKHLKIRTGNSPIVMIHKRDASLMEVYSGDKVRLNACDRTVIASVDITTSQSFIKPGEIGLFLETSKAFGKIICALEVKLEKKPKSIAIIKKKLKGKRLNYNEFFTIIKDIVAGKLSEIEISYFVAAGYVHELTIDETASLTKAIINTGDVLTLNKKIIVDKHCIGGVAANRTTMIVVPILAAAGLTIPKTSSRSITSAAGTADTVEVFSPVDFDITQMKKIIRKTGACLAWGGSMNLAPADDKIIKVEYPMSLDPVGQLIASILGKKKSVSSTHILIDIPVGKGSKIENLKHALQLKQKFLAVAKRLRVKLQVVITDGSQPIGNGIGPALEAKDVIKVLQHLPDQSTLLREKSLMLAGEMFCLVKKAKTSADGYLLAKKILDEGKAWKKFVQIITVQGGSMPSLKRIRYAYFKHDIIAKKSGKVTHIDNGMMNRLARVAGAPFDKEAGVFLYQHKGDHVKKGDLLFTVYSDNKERLSYALQEYKKKDGFVIG